MQEEQKNFLEENGDRVLLRKENKKNGIRTPLVRKEDKKGGNEPQTTMSPYRTSWKTPRRRKTASTHTQTTIFNFLTDKIGLQICIGMIGSLNVTVRVRQISNSDYRSTI